ncbi:MAG TPA: type II toxin-antitoxin system VapC family toxin [Acetobacteraceae bacterium]|nr:type II toxin-antitoxin system VapC family toxin [Acetobacteraceae bacterium]
MRVYPDASVLVALFTYDRFTARARAYLTTEIPTLVVSDFAAAEFASAVSRRVRTNDLTPDEGRIAFTSFDSWLARSTQHVDTTTQDIAAAAAALRRLDLNLRTPDAINIAVADRLGATLATFDEKMATAARALGVQVAPT